MLAPLLLLACAPEPAPDSATYGPPIHQSGCDPVELESDTLEWSDPGPGGVSAEDVFGYAVGTHAATLTWDDGTITEATFTVTPGSAIQQRTGEDEACPVAMTGLVDWEIGTADGRLSLPGSAQWEVTDASVPAGGALIAEALGDANLSLARLNPGSSRWLRLYLGDDGALVLLQVEEGWPLTTDTNRVCVRGTLDPAAIECHDTTENEGPD